MMKRSFLHWCGPALAFVIGLVLLARSSAQPQLVADSGLYLAYAPTVPLSYPLFLNVFQGKSLIVAQLSLYTAAVAMLSGMVSRNLGRPALAVALSIALFANPQTNLMLQTVMSEGLFLSLAVCWLALIISFAANGSIWTGIAAACVAGLAVTVRPAVAPLVAVTFAVTLMRHEHRSWRRRTAFAFATLLIGFGFIAAERVAWHRFHGNNAYTLSASHLFGKAAMLPNPGSPPASSASAAEKLTYLTVQTKYAPVRALLASQRGTVGYPVLLAFYEVCAQHKCSHELRRELKMPVTEQNTVISRVSVARIKANLLGYAGLVWDEYRALWVVGTRSHPLIGPSYQQQINALRPVPLEGLVQAEMWEPVPFSRAMLLIRPALILMGILSFIVMALTAFLSLVKKQPSNRVLPAFAAAAAAHGICLFIAVFGIGEGRYAMGIWPFTASSLLLFCIATYTPHLGFSIGRRYKTTGNAS